MTKLPRLSEVSQQYLGQPMFRIIDLARSLEQQGLDVVHLEIGDPDFGTPHPIKTAAIRALEVDDTHYVSSWGLPEFRQAICDATRLSRNFEPNLNQVLVTPGANVGIWYAIESAVDPGDEVLYPDPGFPTYRSTIAATSARGVPYTLNPDDGFQVTVSSIEPHITSKSRLLILNSPQNPTGAVTTEENLREVFALAAERDLWVYADEIYARMNFGDTKHFSVSSIDRCLERTILSNGFSKAFAMTGWRLGTLIAPAALAERMMLLLQTTASCVPPFIQRGGLEALMGDQAPINTMMNEYRARRDFVIERLNSIPGVSCANPGGAFYAFPNVSVFGLSSEEVARRLLEECFVATVPGNHFGSGGEGFIRLAFATSMERLELGLERMKKFFESLQ